VIEIIERPPQITNLTSYTPLIDDKQMNLIFPRNQILKMDLTGLKLPPLKIKKI
jgi:hypothetical protein